MEVLIEMYCIYLVFMREQFPKSFMTQLENSLALTWFHFLSLTKQ